MIFVTSPQLSGAALRPRSPVNHWAFLRVSHRSPRPTNFPVRSVRAMPDHRPTPVANGHGDDVCVDPTIAHRMAMVLPTPRSRPRRLQRHRISPLKVQRSAFPSHSPIPQRCAHQALGLAAVQSEARLVTATALVPATEHQAQRRVLDHRHHQRQHRNLYRLGLGRHAVQEP